MRSGGDAPSRRRAPRLLPAPASGATRGASDRGARCVERSGPRRGSRPPLARRGARAMNDDRAGALIEAGDLAAAAEAVVRDYGPQILGYLTSDPAKRRGRGGGLLPVHRGPLARPARLPRRVPAARLGLPARLARRGAAPARPVPAARPPSRDDRAVAHRRRGPLERAARARRGAPARRSIGCARSSRPTSRRSSSCGSIAGSPGARSRRCSPTTASRWTRRRCASASSGSRSALATMAREEGLLE